MICYPAPHARFAVRQEDLVVLDLEAGVYSCLAGAGAAISLAGAVLDLRDDDLADLLRSAGLLTTHPSLPPFEVEAPPLPRRDLFDAEAVRPRLGDVATVGLAYGDMLARFYGRPFGQLIATARRARRPGVRPPDAEPSRTALRQVAAFQQSLPWIPFQGECLYRSFMLQRALRRRGEDAWWVFGVQTWPFEAHCWLQIGEVVLDDAAERVAAFTPILTV